MYYEEDFYNQMEADEFDNVSMRQKTSSQKFKTVMDNLNDKKCHTIKRDKKRPITVFSSGQTGSIIRNAVTGGYTNHVVGSTMEDLYYRVSCDLGTDRKKLFFDSPEQYERHFGQDIERDVTNGKEIKREWIQRANTKRISIQ